MCTILHEQLNCCLFVAMHVILEDGNIIIIIINVEEQSP